MDLQGCMLTFVCIIFIIGATIEFAGFVAQAKTLQHQPKHQPPSLLLIIVIIIFWGVFCYTFFFVIIPMLLNSPYILERISGVRNSNKDKLEPYVCVRLIK